MTKYTFDVKAFISITVEADSIAAARKKVDTLDGNTANLGMLDDQPVVETVSFDGEHDLTEIDGETPCFSCDVRKPAKDGMCAKCGAEG